MRAYTNKQYQCVQRENGRVPKRIGNLTRDGLRKKLPCGLHVTREPQEHLDGRKQRKMRSRELALGLRSALSLHATWAIIHENTHVVSAPPTKASRHIVGTMAIGEAVPDATMAARTPCATTFAAATGTSPAEPR